MIRHETLNPPQHIYPVNPWKIIETAFYPRFLAQTETIFSIGNGYIGIRGTHEESVPVFQRGTFVNGFHESWPIEYGEEAYGFAKKGQTIVNVPDGTIIRLFVDDEPFRLESGNILLYERTLDMKSGTLDRTILWETPTGKQVLIESRRFVSHVHRHLAVITYQVTLLNAEAPIVIVSEMRSSLDNQSKGWDPRRSRVGNSCDLDEIGRKCEGSRMMLLHSTRNSLMTVGCGAEHVLETDCEYRISTTDTKEVTKLLCSVAAKPGKPIQILKYLCYYADRAQESEDMYERVQRTLDRAVQSGFNDLVAGQRAFLDDFWERSDVEFDMEPTRPDRTRGEVQQALRWNLFQLLQACGRADGMGVPAKGLTGQTYEGHYFWDTEIYVLPFLIYTAPRLARNLLRFRYSMLDKARERAKELNQRGALFPWRTITGEEASAYYAAGTAQYHINADIVYALRKYVEATGDRSLLYNEGAEILVETARLWYDLGFYAERCDGMFCIHGVTGPDEYTTVVNNNAYTNLMARENLRYAAETVTEMANNHPQHYETLVHRTSLELSEVVEWKRAADRMYIPRDSETGILPQDDTFLVREVWDLKATPRDRFPLLLYYHPLVIYRHQVIKQADVVLALFLLGDKFSTEDKKRNFDYYDPLTTGDSSLSACIQSIVASEIGDKRNALRYARYAMLMDLADVGGNVRDGCHIASMGGTWMVVVYGFAGMRDFNGEIRFDPRIPKEVGRIRFVIEVRGMPLLVEMDGEKANYTLKKGEGLLIFHQGEVIHLSEKTQVSRTIRPHGE